MKQTTLRLPEKLHKQLREEALKKGISINAHILSILWNALIKDNQTGIG